MKKVVVERFDRERLRGYVHPQSYRQAEGLELMSPDGSVAVVGYEQVRAVSFVRELDGAGVMEERRHFLARPKTAGLWVELKFRDGEVLEGVVANNLLALEPEGIALTPPESAGNAQRVFVPRQALAEVVVLGVIGGKRRRMEGAPASQQIRLFGEE